MADVTFPDDATARTPTTLESDDMSFMGFDGSDDPLITDYSDIKSAIETEIASDFLSKTNTTTYTPTADYHPSTKKYVDDNSSSGADYILIRDVKTSGTDGGASATGSFETRDLNEITSDSGGHASLSTNQVTLAAGTYVFIGRCPGYKTGSQQAMLYNVSDTAVIEYGETGASIGSVQVDGEFTIAASKTVELRHRVAVSSADGHGIATSFSTEEVYATLKLWKTA